MNSFDLHMHSHHSLDGEFTPRQLIKIAKEAGLTTIALSDHNCVLGVPEIIEEAKGTGIQIIPAVEMSTLFQGLEVHVLGYNIDCTHPYFHSITDVINKKMRDAIASRIEKIKEYYELNLDVEALIEQYKDEVNPFPSMIKSILCDPKNASIPDFQDYLPGGSRCEPMAVNFYWDKCSPGNPCYIEFVYPDLEETVRIIHEAGGIAVLAHPWVTFYEKEDLIEQVLACGIDGIEAYSNYHQSIHNEYFDTYCTQHGILMTCGSDFHGKTKPAITMGTYGYEKSNGEEILEQFLKKLHTYQL